MTVGKQQTVTKWKIARLKDHPQQAAMFGDVNDTELEALTENMEKNGLRVPVEILPDGTVITGHQRVRAARRLGWNEIDVIVRHDLAAEGAAAIETHFVEDNFVRRQLSPLSRAKCIQRLMELETGRVSSHFGVLRKEELKQRIATRMKLTPRSVSRYLLVLTTPPEIQKAFDNGKISLVLAGKVAQFDKKVQVEIAKRIAADEKASSLVREYTQIKDGTNEKQEVARAYVRLTSALSREVPKLWGHIDELNPRRVQHSAPAVKQAVELLQCVLAAAESKAS